MNILNLGEGWFFISCAVCISEITTSSISHPRSSSLEQATDPPRNEYDEVLPQRKRSKNANNESNTTLAIAARQEALYSFSFSAHNGC